MKTEFIGHKTRRVDALAKVTGAAQYVVDLTLPGMLHAALTRSPHAHARIVSIDTSQAQAVPGVWAVVTGADFPHRFGPMIKDQYFLAVDRVRYVGEPVAAVAAQDETIARQAAALVKVEYEPLPVVFDPVEAGGEDAPLLHPEQESYNRNTKFVCQPGSNYCTVKSLARGDLAEGLAQADHVFEDTFSIHPVAHTPMEPHAGICQYDPGSQTYTFHSSSDAPHRRANEVAQALGIPLRQVRFIAPYQGGGFGGKGTLVTEGPLMALAQKCPGRPIKMVFTREEELTASQTRVGAVMTIKTGVTKDGRVTARSADLIWDSGAYASKAPEVCNRGAMTVLGPYRVPHLAVRTRLVYTNKQISGAYRGFGTTQVTWAGERQMDMIASRLGLDPLEFRRQNLVSEGDPFINGQPMVGVGIAECLEKAAAEIGWGQPAPASAGFKRRGRGLAIMMKGTNTPSESFAFIKLDPDASCTVLTSSPEIGAGQQSVVSLIAAETIGLPLDWVRAPLPDTAHTPYDFGATSSRSTFHVGNAVKRAAEGIRQQLLATAAQILETTPERIEIRQGVVRADDGREVGLPALLKGRFGARGGAILSSGGYSPEGSPLLAQGSGDIAPKSIFWLFVAHAVDLEVDTQTGEIQVLKVAAAHDVGRAISPLGCQQQIEGAVVMGLSNALLEEFKTGPDGRVLNDSLADYKIATIKDLPEIVTILVETMHPEGPYGAKGAGEPAVAPLAPALANALQAALGVEINQLPLTPEKVLAALKGQRLPASEEP